MKGSFYLVAKAQIKYCCARDDSISYTYDPDGIRTSKTVNGTTTKYHVMNGTLLGQTKENDTIVFLYDEKANRYGFDYNGTKYYYIFNVQGDVIGILNQSGSQIVSYQYDPWGKVLSVSGSEASTIGQLNPIRYRGYYYDTETGFYYLQSRYYDPTTRRFLNADSIACEIGDLQSHNIFAYCHNNPVNYLDSTGKNPIAAVFGAIEAAAQAFVMVAVVAVVVYVAYPYVASTVNRVAQGIQDAVNNAKNIVEQKDNSVYKLVDSAGQTRYVGITNNTERRRKEHKNNPNHPERAGYRMDVIATGLTRYEARAVEQTVIAAFTLEKLDNARNEIAKGNLPKFRSEMGAVVEIFQGFNEDEVYNLLTGNW